jgi:hypothetical protein
MAKSAGPGRCVHCLREVEERNWDHVLPASWYPETTPPDLEKWTAPSCIKCNSEYGKLEQDLLIRFGLCLDPHDTAAKGIVDKALRSIKPEYGRDAKDRKARLKKQKEILGEMRRFPELPNRGIFPNFGPAHHPGPDGYYGVQLDKKKIERLTEKIVRGVAFVQDEIFIDENYDLAIYFLEDSGAELVVEMIAQYGVQLHRGPGLIVKRAVIPEDPRAGLYAIEIWQRAKMYAAITPKEPESEQVKV